MKIHKLNLENYYRNAIDSAIAVLSHLPEAVFAGRPTYNNALLRFNDGEAPVLMLENVNAFQNLPANYQILVPSALLDTWKTTGNWANSAVVDHIVAHQA